MPDKFETEKTFSRRGFLKMSGVATGSLVAGTYLGSLLDVNTSDENTETETASEDTAQNTGGEAAVQEDYTRAYKFFTKADDFKTIEAAAERIFPEDELGPGAIALGVGWFIDHELASGYGVNAREYMKGPFKEGTDFQGPQYAILRRDLFMEAIRVMNVTAQENHDVLFHELEPEQQDDILSQLESDELELRGAKASDFFEELRLATLSGAYADPLYRGNKGMQGWEMKKFPGAYMSYINEVEQEGPVELEPMALSSHSESH
ncbi:gluconate 2-dehydrogenase [Jeotgalicoccus coquinae]|uniref:Gluconate 2-dehydrogenase gamma chain n=1 Tax=Jeotgalicoccus coquinae TaxID=709509 RepID=A0A6V7R0Q4_9STAP|nr:gluconate 2-dehydrogenase subunit 3 family protein [Jeotgalicoccus coquinae]MBB6423786.1 gluconate 2-dehydrogenase gamma chain [Jeotgalicoccus coquinae]GGE22555.1 gluconate 2-dehydrogenase [Jeotgalicoccus coquinae]CAD2070668.1 Gluconate 2-dehydrogenase subunit 3 precursor [Jeotgalicoccus coquinae]